MEVKTFYNGNTMPQIGLGHFVWKMMKIAWKVLSMPLNKDIVVLIPQKVYGNEEQVGAGIRAGLESTGIAREDLFITSKLYFEDFGRENVAAACLKLVYLD